MAIFEIDGKEYELKLVYKSIKYLDELFDGGTYELIGLAIQGDINAFPRIVHAALMHTGENFSYKKVEKQVETLIDDGKLSFDDISRISDEVVTQSFFFKATVEKLLKANPEMKKALDQLRG